MGDEKRAFLIRYGLIMKNQIVSLGQTELSSSVLFAAGADEEDASLWSLADLLTLLLIFFIFLYAQPPDCLLSPTSNGKKLAAPDTAPPIHLTFPASEKNDSILLKPVSIRPEFIHYPDEASMAASEDTAPPPSHSTGVKKSSQVQNDPESGEAENEMDHLRKAALTAIHETQNGDCAIRWNQNRLVFVLGERLTFPIGEASLLSGFTPTLQRIAHLICDKTEFRVMVSGHTDDTPISTDQFPSNWELSAARAITVAKSLIKCGVEANRISVQGYGEFRPIHKNSSPENKQANRRVEIALFKEEIHDQNLGNIF